MTKELRRDKLVDQQKLDEGLDKRILQKLTGPNLSGWKTETWWADRSGEKQQQQQQHCPVTHKAKPVRPAIFGAHYSCKRIRGEFAIADDMHVAPPRRPKNSCVWA